jgi:glycerol-3-phosphate acyltransferase PlsY
MYIALSLVIGYLLGSIPFAYLISRQKGIDIRVLGDRNVGAFNVFRNVGFGAGMATLILDVLKGTAAILIAKAFNVDEITVFLTGLAVVAGHNWPVFLGFKGGRGEATILGVFFALVPLQITITLILAIIVLFTTRNSIWASMLLFIPLPFICLAFYLLTRQPSVGMVIYSVVLPCLAGITHWFTTRRLPPEAKRESGNFWIANQKNN